MIRKSLIHVVAAGSLAVLGFHPAASHAQNVVKDDRESLSFDDLTYWKGLTADKAEKHEGTQSGAWSDTVGTERVRYRGQIIDASDAKAVRFWLHSAEATGSLIAIALVSENDKSESGDYYFANVKIDFTGWREITVPFADMKVRREPVGFNRINEILFASSGYGCGDPSPKTVLKIDDLRFVGAAGAPSAPAPAPPASANTPAGAAPAAPAGPGVPGVVPPGFETLLGFEDGLLWKGLIQDSDHPVQGQYSARWEGTDVTNRVSAKKFPSDLSAFDGIVVSVWSAKATGAQIALSFVSENPATEDPDYFLKLVTIDWNGWKDVKIPFSEFGAERSPLGWNSITAFRMASSGYKIKSTSPETVLKFDNMRFIPKGAKP